MFFELFLGMKYLRAKRKQTFISLITFISMLGVMVGVMSLIVVLSVMNGFRADLMSKIMGVNAHIRVLSYKGAFGDYSEIMSKVDSLENVVATTPFIYSQVMVNHSGYSSGAVLRGVDTDTASSVVDIAGMIKGGGLDALSEGTKRLPGIIVGTSLAKKIGAFAGDVLSMMAPEGKLTPLGRAPNTRQYRIVGIFDSGMYEYDVTMVFVSLLEAQDFLGMKNRVTGLEVRVEDPDDSDLVCGYIRDFLGPPFRTQDWKTRNRSLFSALKLEKITMFIILSMIVLVGALNIISALVMVVMEKTKDVAILRAMGSSAKSIMAIFMIQGLFVGICGTVLGLLSGLGICRLLAEYEFITLPADVYYISTLPVRVEIADVLLISLSAVVISFLATIYPSRHASKLDPVEALRYE